MKKILLLIAALAIISCKSEVSIDYAIVSGKILNTSITQISVASFDRKISKEFKVDSEGNFRDTLNVKSGVFSFYDGENYENFHVESGNDIQIYYDANDFTNSLKFTGKGSEISSYLLLKKRKSAELIGVRGEIFKLNEADFKQKCNEIKTAIGNLISAQDNISSAYIENEKKQIHYEYLSSIQSYEGRHAYYAKVDGFKVSKDFLSDFEGFDYSNEEDFKTSSFYKDLIEMHYRGLASELAISDSISNDIAYLKTIGKITIETIKNELLYNEAIFGIKYAKDIDNYYGLFTEASTNSENNEKITEIFNNLSALSKGKPSPKFVDYENFDGSKTSLDDLKGKYVYIDVWATWCGPCKAEIPYLQKVEKEYHNKNIQFVSLSLDKQKDKDKWKQMIKDKELTGIQLIAPDDFKSDFPKGYMINAIPQFILLDPDGNIVAKNAPRPSDDKLIELFDSLSI